MLNEEEYAKIRTKIDGDEELTKEEILELVQTIVEIDANLVILQNALELSVLNARDVIPAVAEKITILSGRTDAKFKKKVINYAAEITARFELAIQLYISEAYEQTQKILQNTDESQEILPMEDTSL